MPKYSAGLLVYRFTVEGALEVLIVHPGGPFWMHKDEGAWSIPKGEYEPPEEALLAAEREFVEELGQFPPQGERIELGELRLPSGKRLVVWAVEGVLDVAEVTSNEFELEWPPHSGLMRSFPEVDRAAWVSAEEARRKLSNGQQLFIDRLVDILATEPP